MHVAEPVLLFVTLCIAAFGSVHIYIFQAFGQVGCASICHDELIFGARNTYPWVLGAAIVAMFTGSIIAIVRRRSSLWITVGGAVLVTTAVIGTVAAVEIGYRPMYERNALISGIAEPAFTRPAA